MSRVAKKLEDFADEEYLFFQSYVCVTNHRNIAFDFEAMLRKSFVAMGLLERGREWFCVCMFYFKFS